MFHHCRKGGYASSAFTLTFDRPRGGGSDLLPPPLSECAVYGLNALRREKSHEIFFTVMPETVVSG